MDPIDAFPEHISTTVVPMTLPDKPDVLEYAARQAKSELASSTKSPPPNGCLSCFVKTIGIEERRAASTYPDSCTGQKATLEEKSLPFTKKRVRITPVMRRVTGRPELPMALVQIPHVLEPVQIPFVPQPPVQIPHVTEPPAQIPVSQVPQPSVQISVSQVPQPPVQIPHVPEPPVQILQDPEPMRIPPSSTLWSLWSQRMHSTNSRRSYLDPQPKNSSCFTRVHVPRSFGKTVIKFTSHLNLTWNQGFDLKYFRVGRSPSRQVWPQNTDPYPLDLTHCTRLADVYVTWLTWLDDWEMHRDENLPCCVVCPQPWKRALETYMERSHQNALAHGMPSDVFEHI
ncbi:hypothetical protein TNCV_3101351 [Trichonephila clavipes]|nr:hypothetical protein TNCV_3101351 [Trichonephila clavipes]